jgi:Carboxypeptidase regulatory-like domain
LSSSPFLMPAAGGLSNVRFIDCVLNYFRKDDATRVAGLVLDPDQPAPGANVNLISPATKEVIGSSRANDKGEFTFAKVDPEKYPLLVSRAGHQDELTENFWVARETTPGW